MRHIGLDLLRVFAVILVIGRHLYVPENASVLLKIWRQGGWVGVDLFFVLSGFLVASLLFREYARSGQINTTRFLIRRGFKLYPAFWLFLGFSIAIQYRRKEPPATQQVVGELLFLQNYLGGVWNHTWSLAVEEHFYIALAILVTFLLWAMPKSPFSIIPKIFFVVAAICLSLRMLNPVIYPEYNYREYLFATHIRIDSLFFGVLLSYLCQFRNLEKRMQHVPTLSLFAVGAALFSPAFIFPIESHKWITIVGVIPLYVGSGAMLLGTLRYRSSANSAIRLLAALGAASYSIYLWHMPVATWGYQYTFMKAGIDNYYIYIINAVCGACLFGWVLNRLIERPILLLRDRLFPSMSGAAT